MHRSLDINVDLGESYAMWSLGHDEELFPLISSANIACGFHAGDPATLVKCLATAAANDVAVGAHPGLPDILGFGRRRMAIDPEDAYAYVAFQAGAMKSLAGAHGLAMSHVKLHGAFAASVSGDKETTLGVLRAVADLMEEPVMFYSTSDPSDPFPSVARDAGVRIIGELYPDLDYRSDGSLVIQRRKRHTDPDVACRQVSMFLEEGCVDSIDGDTVELEAESICIHGDGPNAVELVTAIRDTLTKHDVELRSPGWSNR